MDYKVQGNSDRADTDRLKTLFQTAVAHDSTTERERFLSTECGEDMDLRRQIDSLLQAHERAGDFLTSPPKPVFSAATEQPGTMIGRYKLIELLGEGGFGVVWKAEQETPVRREVALKLIKAGMDTKQVLARFESERQALAMMDHPGIARVLDAAATDAGRPYFVMELVQGARITDFCDARKFPTRERLLLFVRVCQAVQHAHQKGVIHRDLKPSNILIAEIDGSAVPKIIDFGVAKAIEKRLTEHTVVTGQQEMIGTPCYMSPEQAGLGGPDIDTRSDIYSLGTLLYELLTGGTPLTPQQVKQCGPDEVFRLVREAESPKPSARLESLDSKQLRAIAEHRSAHPAQLLRETRGDLDWIAMKALEKERSRRYATASGFAADIGHHLNNEPVLAGPPSNFYRLQKGWRRHRTAFASSIAIALLLVGATVVSICQAVRATRAEALAKKRLTESEGISRSLSQMAQHSFTVGTLQNSTPVFVFDAAGRKAAIDVAERILAFNREVHGGESSQTMEAMENLSDAYAAAHRGKEAINLREQALALRRKNNGPTAPETRSALEALAMLEAMEGHGSEATTLLGEAVRLDATNTGQWLQLATWQVWFGQEAAYEETRRNFERQAELVQKADVPARTKALNAERSSKAYCLRPTTNTTEISQVVALAKSAIGVPNRTNLPWEYLALGMAEYRNADFTAADEALRVAEEGMHNEAQYTASFFHAMSLFQQNKAAEGRALFDRAEAGMPREPASRLGPQHLMGPELLVCWLAHKEAKAVLIGGAAQQ